jgi:hypothetical protein
MLVRISKELKYDVGNYIDNRLKPKDYRLEFGVERIHDTFKLPASHPIIAKITWGEHLHLKSLMPSTWLEPLSTYGGDAHLRLTVTEGDKYHSVDIKVQGDTKSVTVPPRCTTSHRFTVPSDICPEIKGFYDLKVRETALIEKWSKIRSDIRAFLDSAKSLNAALKAWPGLQAFIPDEYLERINTKVERKASVEAMEQKLAEIDRDMATTAATAVILAA